MPNWSAWRCCRSGIPVEHVLIMAEGAALHAGLRHPVQDLFVPEDDYHDFHHALGRGHALLIVRPVSAEARDAAVTALEKSSPLDFDEHGRHWRGTAAPAGRMQVNHANLSRADMHGRAIGGRDEVILDMTGQKMNVRMMSEADMAEGAVRTDVDAGPATGPRWRRLCRHATCLCRGRVIPMVFQPRSCGRMSPEEQVMAQPHSVEVPGDNTTRGTFLRTVDQETRLGWRDSHPSGVRVRSYVTERPTDAMS